jgi:hypothetical protein
MYFTFTTLSSLGLGDLYPHTDAERILCTLFLLFGVAIYSFVSENFTQMF